MSNTVESLLSKVGRKFLALTIVLGTLALGLLFVALVPAAAPAFDAFAGACVAALAVFSGSNAAISWAWSKTAPNASPGGSAASSGETSTAGQGSDASDQEEGS